LGTVLFDVIEAEQYQVGLKTLVPLLTAVPVINILANLTFCQIVPLLNLAFELFSTAVYNVKIVVSELSPLLLDPAFNLLPISFDSIPVHVNLRRSGHDMTGTKHSGSAMVPFTRPEHGFVKLSPKNTEKNVF
jgi:hypothetical protein